MSLAARRAWATIDVVEVERDQNLALLSGADVIVLASPIDAIMRFLATDAARFAEALIIDTGSTKRRVLTTAREAHLSNFIGGHPMAGGATSGPAAARAELFDGKPWFLFPSPNASLLECARGFVTSLGATPVVMTDDGGEHDRIMAAVSHLPQLVASLLMTVSAEAARPNGLRYAGAGLRDTTRLAASSADVWQSILATNAGEIGPLLRTLADDLQACADALEDKAATRTLFEAANHYHAILTGVNDAT